MAQLLVASCLLIVAFLFWNDPKEEGETTSVLWIPFLWMFFAGSRFPSAWLAFDGHEGISYDEGSPMDRMVFLVLLVAGLIALARRNIDWGKTLGRNKLLLGYFLYCLLSTLWSPETFISFKRWFKDLGNPIMVLLVLTEPAPLRALGTLLRRLSYVLLPLSFLFVRYFPELGRVYGVDGTPLYTGVGQQKNALGQICLVTGTYFVWQMIVDRARYLAWTRIQRWSLIALFVVLGYLLYLSNSQTSLACLIVASAIVSLSRMPVVRRRPANLADLSVGLGALYLLLDAALDLKNTIIRLLGRDPSLTSRTDLWAVLHAFSSDPILGVGFMSFWTGDRLQAIWEQVGQGVLQAHSGYLEQFLNLGYVGLTLMFLVMLRAFFGIRRQTADDLPFATLRYCFLSTAILSNYTEAGFYGVSNIWIVTLFATIEVVQREAETAATPTALRRPMSA